MQPKQTTRSREPGPEMIRDRKLYREMGLTDEEYERVVRCLGRLPNWTETGIYSVMWSEHCSYKNSKPLLQALSRRRSPGPAGARGRGRRDRHRGRAGGGVQDRKPQPSFGRGALPGGGDRCRRDHSRCLSPWGRVRLPCSIPSGSDSGPSPGPLPVRPGGGGDRPLRQPRRRFPPWAGRCASIPVTRAIRS